jgi:hypothetical protein
LLEDIIPDNTHFEGFEVEHAFEHVGYKKMLLNAHRVQRADGQVDLILLAIEDVTERDA